MQQQQQPIHAFAMRPDALAASLRGLPGASGDGCGGLWWPLASFCLFTPPGRAQSILKNIYGMQFNAALSYETSDARLAMRLMLHRD